ncbi:MAG TPA: thiosulfate oxidation carrier protein SoxY [Geminicoccaceae bacterium]|nr:thiosulfate oxidation carrier protein SoxY [Geminicoccaceae bacterium]
MPDEADRQRRSLLRGAVGLACGGIALGARPASATPEPVTKLLDGLTGGGNAPAASPVRLELPEIAEDGSFVPLTVVVDCPMTEADHVRAIRIVAKENPQPEVAVFHLTPLNGRAEVSTRVRLARSQVVTVLAEMSDGSVFAASAPVKVMLGGCG